jgi:hypothetical protein
LPNNLAKRSHLALSIDAAQPVNLQLVEARNVRVVDSEVFKRNMHT